MNTKIIVFNATKPAECVQMNKFLENVDVVQVLTAATAYAVGGAAFGYKTSIFNFVTIVYKERE
jgi:hypothetical protein